MQEKRAENIEQLKRRLLRLSALVEENTRRSVIAFRSRDRAAAVEIIKVDAEINELEIFIEEDCVELLDRTQRSPDDTRFIVAVLKINNDLERIGDLASNVARRVLHIGQHEQVRFPQELLTLAEYTLEMVTTSIDSFVDLDMDLARRVCERDHEVDKLNRLMYSVVQERIVADPNQAEKLLNFLSISRYLERIADYATNIAEDVVYIGEGRIIRHQEHNGSQPQ
ncbi:MAG: phosphate signaling complex protein PhoU [Bacteroidetes bacterium]|nr:phosphate signaling complex protein PhoU [Bacteroidota bacterium]